MKLLSSVLSNRFSLLGGRGQRSGGGGGGEEISCILLTFQKEADGRATRVLRSDISQNLRSRSIVRTKTRFLMLRAGGTPPH